MPVITISRGSYHSGKQVAEIVAKELGYECISREVLLQAAEEFDVPEVKLVRAIHDAPSILERFVHGKRRFLAYVRSAFLDRVQKDNVVYHGLAGHFLVAHIPHVLKVRIVAEMGDRVELEVKRRGISREEALEQLRSDDNERLKWSRDLYGIDTTEPTLYDLVIRIKKITVDHAAEIICKTASLQEFQTTPASRQLMDDIAAAAKVEASLMDLKSDVSVCCDMGVVHIQARHADAEEKAHMRWLAERVSGVKKVCMD